MTGKKSESKRCAVAVFVKYPEPGRVKTRLARSIGDNSACEAYKKLLKATWENALKNLPAGRFETVFCFDPFREIEAYRVLLEQDITTCPVTLIPQQGLDLGERLKNTFALLCEKYQHVITIGTDCPWLLTREIVRADQCLMERKTLVLGPATDGGYYLIGLSSPQPALFEEISWSTDQVLEQTLGHAEKLHLSYSLLDPIEDVDSIEEWERWKAQSPVRT